MSVSNSLGRSLTDLSHPDWILLTLPLLFVGSYGVCLWIVGTQSVALAVAALLCSVLVVDGLFFRPPTRS
jgi:hypothetical protein